MKLSAQTPLFSRVSIQDKLLFTKHLSVMIHSGIPLIEALGILIDQTKTGTMNAVLQSVYKHIKNGKTLAYSLEQYPNTFDVFFTNIVQVGEESGTLEQMLSKVADFYEEGVDNSVDSLSSLLEPMIMTVLGVLVGGLVIAMYLPIFKLGSVV